MKENPANTLRFNSLGNIITEDEWRREQVWKKQVTEQERLLKKWDNTEYEVRPMKPAEDTIYYQRTFFGTPDEVAVQQLHEVSKELNDYFNSFFLDESESETYFKNKAE